MLAGILFSLCQHETPETQPDPGVPDGFYATSPVPNPEALHLHNILSA